MSQQLFPSEPFALQNPVFEPRKAALLVHAMPEADQQWILDQMPEGQKEVLNELLTELKELGIPADPALLKEVISSEPNSRAGRSEDDDQSISLEESISAMDQADPAVLAGILSEEPPGLIARFLLIHEWRWTGAFMDHLSSVKTHQVEEQMTLMRGAAPAHALHTQLLRRIQARVSLQNQVTGSPSLKAIRSSAGFAPKFWWQQLKGSKLLHKLTGVDG